MRKTLLAALLAAAALAAPAAARANSTQESIIQDDTVLLNGNPGPALDQMKALGATTIHTLAFWGKIAPSANSARRPAGDLSNPASYSDAAWAPYDALVRGASARGLQILMSPTGFTPRWAGCRRLPRRIHNCRPNAKLYQAFVTALGRRYSGTYRDSAGNVLPRVGRWSIWNEPDQIGWIYPQASAPLIYRNLVYAGLAGLRNSGHGRDQVLLGETAPTKRGRNSDPTSFLLNVFCVDARGHRLRGKAGRRMGCTHFKRLSGITGIAHHPYNNAAGGPALKRPRGAGDITLAVISRLNRVLRAGARGHAIRGGLPIYFTEYGIQTNPPDRKFGVSPSHQAMWLNEADYTAYRNRSVRSVAQYELVDDPVTSVFNTGLFFKNGRAKPSLGAYRLPIWVKRRGSRVSIWLWVRPAAGKRQQVQIQHASGHSYRTVTTKSTNSRGFATVTERGTSGKWRIAWTGPDGVTYFSRAGSVRDR
jgi:hypothetical protein